MVISKNQAQGILRGDLRENTEGINPYTPKMYYFGVQYDADIADISSKNETKGEKPRGAPKEIEILDFDD